MAYGLFQAEQPLGEPQVQTRCIGAGTTHCLVGTPVSLSSFTSLLPLWPLRMFIKIDQCEVILLHLN